MGCTNIDDWGPLTGAESERKTEFRGQFVKYK